MHSTNNLEDGYIGSGKRLWYSIKKYGKENFKLEIVEMLPDRSLLKEREKKLVNEDLLKNPMCMNLKIGGEGGLHEMTEEESKIWHGMGGKKTWELHRDKLSLMITEKNKKNWADGVFDFHYGNKRWLGKKHKPETIEKLKGHKRQSGSENSQFGTQWITNGIENKKIKKNEQIPDGWSFGRTITIKIL